MIASWRVLRFYDDFSPCTAQIFNYSFVSFLLLFVCHLSSSRPIRLRWSIDKFHPTRPVEAASSVFVRKDEEDRRARGNCAFISSPSRRSLCAVVSSCFPFSSSSSRERFQVRDGGTFQISQINDLFPLNDRGSKSGRERNEEDSKNNLISWI